MIAPQQFELPGTSRAMPVPKAVHCRYFWTTPEVKILREHYQSGGIAACMKLLPGRSEPAIYNKAQALGLQTKAKAPRRGAPYPLCPVIDAEITRIYLAGVKRGDLPRLAVQLVRPCWWIKRRAQNLGLATPRIRPEDWTPAEVDILEEHAHRSTLAIARRLRQAGYQRSCTAIAVQISRRGFDRTDPDNWTARQLAILCGVTPNVVCRWIDSHGLPAKRRGTQRTEAQGGDQWWISRARLKRWMADKAQMIDLRRVDKYWFFDLVFGRK